MLSDLSRRLGVNFSARQRSEFVADIHHGVTAFALAVIDPKTKTYGTGLSPNLRDEAVSFVHLPTGFAGENRTIVSGCQSIRTKLSGIEALAVSP
jgi:hypothetical protein